MMRQIALPLSMILAASFGVTACSADTQPEEELFSEDRCDEEGVTCQGYGRARGHENRPPAYELGDDARSPQLTVVWEGDPRTQPIDLEFNPRSPRELWILHYATSHATVVKNPGTRSAEVIERRDPAYTHYMYRPAALAMGAPHRQWGQQWATCGDNDNGGNHHMGPTLYSADLRLFGYQTQGGLGTHLDMLHSTSYCRGIAWAGSGNQYFAFNAFAGAIDFYDFRQDHGPGNNDHSDGVVRRFANRQVRGVTGVMSHLSYDPDTRKLYVADTGNRRILSLDPSTARPVAPLAGTENIAERGYYEATMKVLTSTGLQQPSGIEATGGLAFVTDAATSMIHAFKLSDGSLVRTLETGLPAGSLSGLNFGPDGKIYFVDRRAGRVYRIDP